MQASGKGLKKKNGKICEKGDREGQGSGGKRW